MLHVMFKFSVQWARTDSVGDMQIMHAYPNAKELFELIELSERRKTFREELCVYYLDACPPNPTYSIRWM